MRTPWLAWDHRLAAALQRPVARSRVWRALALTVAHSGDGYLWFPALGLAAWQAPDPWRELARQALVVLLTVALVVTVLKHLIRRRRPESPWGNLYRKTDPMSFPSGHAARGAALMVLTWSWWPDTGISWLATVWALALAWSRMAIGVHYPTDVAAGFLLGMVLALALG